MKRCYNPLGEKEVAANKADFARESVTILLWRGTKWKEIEDKFALRQEMSKMIALSSLELPLRLRLATRTWVSECTSRQLTDSSGIALIACSALLTATASATKAETTWLRDSENFKGSPPCGLRIIHPWPHTFVAGLQAASTKHLCADGSCCLGEGLTCQIVLFQLNASVGGSPLEKLSLLYGSMFS